MKKIFLMCVVGVALSGCTVTTVQTHTRYPSTYTNTYVQHRSHYHHVYPYCRTTYQRGYYGELRAVRVCY